MAAAHERLYGSDNLAELNLDEYISSLVDHLSTSTGVSGSGIRVNRDIRNVSFGLDTATPLGFIISELVSNALKHAYPGNVSGEVTVTLRALDAEEFELTVADNGVGIPPEVDINNPKSLGLELLNIFVEQLHGSMMVNRESGTEFRIRFKEMNAAPKGGPQ
jgi:two-component sensor histidine kinase